LPLPAVLRWFPAVLGKHDERRPGDTQDAL
jgi:hypothetical protein